jgi:hypothetical protein
MRALKNLRIEKWRRDSASYMILKGASYEPRLLYNSKFTGRNTAFLQRFQALDIGIAEWTPYFLAL